MNTNRTSLRHLPSFPATSGLLLAVVLSGVSAAAAEFAVSSPDGRIVAALTHDEGAGTLAYRVRSAEEDIIFASPIGIETDRADFRAGMALTGHSRVVIDETYRLPQGKTSTYRNHANELVLRFDKGGGELHVHFRAYNDGVAFRFLIPGSGTIRIAGESSAIHLAGEHFTYWGQNHPNNFGYESRLGPISGEQVSIPVLAHLADRNHFVLMGQAATYGHYVQPHFQRNGSVFRFTFPLDQAVLGPVKATLPFQSPWRMVIISPETPARIVESHLVENLNPPTDPALLQPDGTVMEWIRPGRVMWDFIAGDRNQPRMWIDAAAEMGWEYYLADAGFIDRFGGPDQVREVTAYAATRNVGVIGWAHTREFNTRESAAATIRQYSEMGLKGAKIDFFDHNTLTGNNRTDDTEDTQESLRMRDWIFELAIEHKFLLEFHGNTMPTGERRRYPNLMTLEGVDGMERRAKPAANDLTIPYVRNVMGPVSYTIVHLERSPGTHAYQLAMSVVYEAGLMIYAEHGRTLLAWPGRELIQDVPSAWDETRFIEGLPAGHVIIARRTGRDWYVGGMTDSARMVHVPLRFLDPGRGYDALLFADETRTTMRRETVGVTAADQLPFEMLERGGFAVRMRPAASASDGPSVRD